MKRKLPPLKVVYNNQIELRLMSPRDGKAIYQGVMTSLPELKRFMNWAHEKTSLATALGIYADFEAKSLKGKELSFAGFDAQTGHFLCCCSLLPDNRLNPLAYEIGYWVASNHTGKGIGTTVTKILISLAFREYQANRVHIWCNTENSRSQKIIEKCGFHFEGCHRNHLMQPTTEMVTAGYSPNTDVLSFSLIPDDLSSLQWYGEFNEKLSVGQYCT